MAKKAAAAKRGAPQKECPDCHSTMHARTSKCAKCGHVFTKKPKIKPKAPRAARRAAASLNGSGGAGVIQAAAAFIRAAGSMENAEATLAALKDLPR